MRKALALVALTLAAGPALAAEQPIRIAVGGVFEGYVAGVDQLDGPGQPGFRLRSSGIYRRARLMFNGDTALDNGLKVGLRVILRGDAYDSQQADQSWAFFDTPYGRFEIGRLRSAAYQMHYAAAGIQTAADPWSLNKPGGDFTGLMPPAANLARRSSTHVDSPKSARVVYYTPRLNGLQFGVSYVPDGCLAGQAVYNSPTLNGPAVDRACPGTAANAFQGSEDPGQQGDRLSFGANYLATVGAVDLALSAGYLAARVENSAGGRYRDQQAWNVGGQLHHAGFILGAAFKADNHGASRATLPGLIAPGRETDWTVGLVRVDGRWRYGVTYIATAVQARDDTGASPGTDRHRAFEIGGSYELGPGVSLTAGAEYHDWTGWRSLPQAVNRGWTWQAGTILRF